jgi:GC-rich sequence DNA-binding factor
MRAAATASAAALAAVREGCSRAQGALTATTAELARTRESLSHCEAQILELEVSGAASGERYKLVQEFRDYIRDLCECLKDKAPLVEELEDHLGRLEEAAAAAYAERADADADDESAPAQAAVAAASGALARGAGEAAARDAAAAAAAMASLAGGASLPPELDELGRDKNAARRVNASRRASGRAARRAKHPPAPGTWTPGQSSESSDGERVSLASGHAAVTGEAATVFADADEDFSTLERVKTRLEAFKRACGRAYRDAYVGESAAALFAPYVRLQLLAWSPVRPGGEREEDTTAGVALDEQPWFQELFDFGPPAGGDAVLPDDDMRLIPRLVAKVVIPRVRRAVDTAWRPDRRRHARRLAAVLAELGPFGQDDADVATDLTMLHGAVALKLVHAAAAARVPAWAPLATAAAGELAQRCSAAAAARATRVVASIAAFDGVLPTAVLVGPAVNTVVLRHMVPHLQSLAQHPLGWPVATRRMRRLAQALPQTWSGSADAQQGMVALGSVAVGLAGALASAASGPDRPDATTVRAVCETLALLNRGDDARALECQLALRE